MIIIFGIILSIIFFSLAGIHFHWALGGNWGFNNAIPTNPNGERVLNPKKIDSAVIGIGLSLFAIFYLIKTELILIDIADWILNSVGWIIACIFIFRAIGEFKHIGFFRSVKNTNFAKFDSIYYSPLRLFIGLIAIILEVIK